MTLDPMPPRVAAPSAASARGRLDALTRRLERFPLAVHLLLFRLAIAGVFLRAGLIKIAGWQSTIALFRDEYKVPVLPPEMAATLAATFEVGCSTLLLLGLCARLATLPLFGMILTIQVFVYPDAWPEHLVWGAILIYVLTRGPGAISADRALGLERADGGEGR